MYLEVCMHRGTVNRMRGQHVRAPRVRVSTRVDNGARRFPRCGQSGADLAQKATSDLGGVRQTLR